MLIPSKPIYSVDPLKRSILSGARWTRSSYAKAQLAACMPVILLIFYMASTSGSKHSAGPAGSALVYLGRESGAIAFAIVTLLFMGVVIFFATLGRLRDINASPLWGLLFFIPGLVIPLMIFLSTIPGTKGKNKYGDDPRVIDDLTQNETDNLSKFKKIRNYATHKNTGGQFQQVTPQENYVDLLSDKHDVIKKILRTQEFLKITKMRGTSGTSLKAVCVGFDVIKSKYYLSVSSVGTPIHEFKRQYFLNYQLMCRALFEQTGLLIEELANEIS